VTAWSDELCTRLAKLIRLLGSPQEGEVVAAARAIQRTLASESLDLHDLVDALLPTGQARVGSTKRSAQPATAQRSDSSSDLIRDVWIVSCESCLQRANKLSPAEFVFVKNFQRDLIAKRLYTRARMKRLMKICSRLGI
jgi:hypothetical protein